LPLSSAGAVAAAGETDEEEVSALSLMGTVAEEESISEGCRESTFIKGDEGLVRSGLPLIPTNQQQYNNTGGGWEYTHNLPAPNTAAIATTAVCASA